MMMNILALFLVLSSIGFRVVSPNPEKKNSRSGGGEDVIVKEAHQLVFNEYEREIKPNNKKQEYERVEEANQKPITNDDDSSPSWVLSKSQINPFEMEQRGFQSVSLLVENSTNEKMREACSVLPNLGHGISGESLSKACEMSKQVVDLKGVSEETAMKTKEMVSDKAHLFKEAAAGAKDTVSRKAHEFKQGIEEAAAETPKKVFEFKEAMKETATLMGAPREEVSEGLLIKSKENVLDNAYELEVSSTENIETTTERAQRFLVDFKHLYYMLEIGLTDDRTAKVKITHFLLEGSRNFTSLFLSVYHASDETVNWSVGVLRLMGFATGYGSCVWVTFVSSHVLSGALPRQQYGMVQSKIYPVYFWVMASSLGLSYLGHFLTRHHEKSSPSEKLHDYDLMASIGLVLANLFFLKQATKVMHDIMKWEKEEGRGIAAELSCVGGSRMVWEVEAEGFERIADGEVREADQAQLERLNKRLKQLNTLSDFCNILTLMVLTSHLASLSRCLYASC